MTIKGLMLILILWLCKETLAQDLINGTNIYIPSEMSIHIDGRIMNNGFLQNHGNISLTGDWQNQHIYQGNGKIVLAGERSQNFYHNHQSVFHLVCNSTSPKFIQGKVVIDQQLDLIKGIVYVNDEDTLLLNESAVVTVGSLSSYVDGALTSKGSGYKFFPVGKNGKYRPLEMLDIKGIAPTIEVEVFEDAPEITLDHVNINGSVYWQRKDLSGFFENSPISIIVGEVDHEQAGKLVMIEGDDFSSSFNAITQVAVEAGIQGKITTHENLSRRIILYGETDLPGRQGEEALYISTALSPNAIQHDNRTVKIFSTDLKETNFFFQVYSRTGKKIYESRSLEEMITKGWDGREGKGGQYLMAGVYPYVLKAEKFNGQPVEKKGVITILR